VFERYTEGAGQVVILAQEEARAAQRGDRHGHLLLAMLGLGGASAELLRQHGLDEAAVRGALGGP
jgi:hypothetical protein